MFTFFKMFYATSSRIKHVYGDTNHVYGDTNHVYGDTNQNSIHK